MKLNEHIKLELTEAIKSTVKSGGTFPIEIHSSGKIKHKICTTSESSGYLIETIEVDGKDYLIYLV